MKTTALLVTASLLLGPAAWAQNVALSGMLGSKALLIVDGGAPKGVAAGESYQNVKVISTQGDSAVLEVAGKRQTLRVGDAPVSVGSSSDGAAGGSKIVLTAGTGGHFMAQGLINGRTVPLMVDTGASSVAISVAEAERIGLKYQDGQAMRLSTANGVIQGWRVKLSSVKVGDVVVHGVDATVSSGSMPYVLLGNTFLARFQMTRNNDQMVLEKRY
jgi:aspartyl protease family protein